MSLPSDAFHETDFVAAAAAGHAGTREVELPLDKRAVGAGVGSSIYRLALVLTWLAVASAATYAGFRYYATPLAERPYSTLHEAYKPSGRVGHTLGVVGSAMMVAGVASYSLRKRARRLARAGRLRAWLQFHIFLCTLGPFLVMLHTSFRVGGLVSIAFWSMVVVVASGVFGRYVYARIPKTSGGHFATRQAAEQAQASLVAALRQQAGLDEAALAALLRLSTPAAPVGFGDALRRAARYDLTRRRVGRRVAERLALLGLAPEARRDVAALLEAHRDRAQQVALMLPFQKLFGYWHVLHLPLALVMFLIMIVHIGVAVLFGYAFVF